MRVSRRELQLGALAALIAGSGARAASSDSLVFRRSERFADAPKRVVALEFLIAETLIAYDAPPIGMSDRRLYPGWIGVGAETLAATVDVGTRQQPSLEAIAALRPDLIVGVDYRHAPLFDALERIAPTVLIAYEPGAGGGTQLDASFATLDLIGRLIGRADRAPALRAEAEAAFARDRDRIEAAGAAGRKIAVLQELGLADAYWVLTGSSMAAGVAKRIGLELWPKEPTREGVRKLLSEELLALDDADVILISATGPAVPLSAKTDSTVWRRAPAYRAGRVRLLERNIWNFGGVGSAMRLSGRLADLVIGQS